VLKAVYDGVSDDLLTAGLGKTGLESAIAPGFANPLQPTPAELRKRAIYVNYRALIDPTPGGGYGVLYGPNVAIDGTVTASRARSLARSTSRLSRRGRPPQRHDDGADTRHFRSGARVHRHRAVVGLARRLRRDRHRG
jgi:hypothetical protein